MTFMPVSFESSNTVKTAICKQNFFEFSALAFD